MTPVRQASSPAHHRRPPSARLGPASRPSLRCPGCKGGQASPSAASSGCQAPSLPALDGARLPRKVTCLPFCSTRVRRRHPTPGSKLSAPPRRVASARSPAPGARPGLWAYRDVTELRFRPLGFAPMRNFAAGRSRPVARRASAVISGTLPKPT